MHDAGGGVVQEYETPALPSGFVFKVCVCVCVCWCVCVCALGY
jgi:hypothetical protein